MRDLLMTNIVDAYPPNYSDICRAIPAVRIQNAVFTYGDTIYAPGGTDLAYHLIAHEETHVRQQTNPSEWWDKYLEDPTFRYEQELEAYRVQYRSLTSREERRKILPLLVKALSGSLYGSIVSKQQAELAIKEEE